ncbi:hypothetical protein TWF281_011189 [Arthrobotrys megalospora]
MPMRVERHIVPAVVHAAVARRQDAVEQPIKQHDSQLAWQGPERDAGLTGGRAVAGREDCGEAGDDGIGSGPATRPGYHHDHDHGHFHHDRHHDVRACLFRGEREEDAEEDKMKQRKEVKMVV